MKIENKILALIWAIALGANLSEWSHGILFKVLSSISAAMILIFAVDSICTAIRERKG